MAAERATDFRIEVQGDTYRFATEWMDNFDKVQKIATDLRELYGFAAVTIWRRNLERTK